MLKPRNNEQPKAAGIGFDPKTGHTGWVERRDGLIVRSALPHLPSPYDDRDVSAWRSLNLGTATPAQQQLALEHLMFVAGLNGNSYIPGDVQATAYAAGRRSVALEIFNYTRMKPRNSNEEQG